MNKTVNKRVLAVILGGGKGTRLYPLTEARSKPAVPIAGKYRLVDIPISNCINAGINKIFVLTQFNSASLNRHVKNTYHFDNFTRGFAEILAAEQTPDSGNWYQGTADAIRQSMHHFLNADFDYFLILSGDQLYQADYNKILQEHIKQKAHVSIYTQPVNANDATGFGIMKTENDEIKTFIEKPILDELGDWKSEVSDEMKAVGREYLASMGIYLFNREVLVEALKRDPEETDFGKHIIPTLVNGPEKVLAYQFEDYWTDIGTIKSFFEANIALSDKVPDFNLYNKDAVVYTRARMLPPSKLYGTSVESSVISEGSILRASRIEKAVVGIRARIGQGSTISHSYIMGSDYFETIDQMKENLNKGRPHLGIGDRCYVENAILDRNVRIGNDVKIVGGDHLHDTENDLYVVRSGIVVVKKNAILPNGFQI